MYELNWSSATLSQTFDKTSKSERGRLLDQYLLIAIFMQWYYFR